jgi:hypothetical protein
MIGSRHRRLGILKHRGRGQFGEVAVALTMLAFGIGAAPPSGNRDDVASLARWRDLLRPARGKALMGC